MWNGGIQVSLFDSKELKTLHIDNIIKDIKVVFELTIATFIGNDGELCRGKKKAFHDTLQRELVALADTYGLLGDKEFLIEGYEDGRNGYIDVVWKGVNGTKLLLEIDSSPRIKSVKKLILGKAEFKIWLYYGIKSGNEALRLDKKGHICFIHIPPATYK